MIIIQVKYLPHTDTKCSRFVATTMSKDVAYKATVSYDYALSRAENRREAAIRLCNDILLDLDGLSTESADLGKLTVGFVYTGEV